MNNNLNNLNMIENNYMEMMRMQLMMMNMNNMNKGMQMTLNNIISEEEKKEEEKKKTIKNYYNSNLYKIDFKRIEDQNKNFKEIIDKLMTYKKELEDCINYNNKIINNYSEDSDKNDNYTNLLKLSSSIEDIYEEKIKEFYLCKNEINNIFKLGIKELKDNYLNDFNKKYNVNLHKDRTYVGFRGDGFLKLNKLDEVKFKELCRINDFSRINELELKFEDNINIDTLIKMPYANLTFLGLLGRIKGINILSKLPFKSLKTLGLSNNNFYDTNLDIFRNVPFHNLQSLILCSNKINNIEGLCKAPFLELTSLELSMNRIHDLKPLQLLPFKKLENLDLDISKLYIKFRFPFLCTICQFKNIEFI